MNAYYTEELFEMQNEKEIAPAIARMDGEMLRIEPITIGHIQSVVMVGADIVAFVELYLSHFDDNELIRLRHILDQVSA